MTTRRGFLGAILAAAAAPAIVRAGSLMPIYVPPAEPVIVGVDWGVEPDHAAAYILFAHLSMFEEMMKVGLVTGEAALYRGELYSYGTKIIRSELPPARELTAHGIEHHVRRADRLTAETIRKALMKMRADMRL